MAWDTETTQRRLRDAAVIEFAATGFAGTSMSDIALRAGINKERLYKYFGDKQTLWTVVVTEELERLAAAVELTEQSLSDIGTFAADLFDYHAAHPELARLLQWEALSPEITPPTDERAVHYQQKVRVFAHAQRDGIIDADLDPGYLMFALIALAAWWHTAPQLASMVTSARQTVRERSRQRAFVAEAARRLARPQIVRVAGPVSTPS